MNGAHDLGGMHGFGRVDAPVDEPVFEADWERRAFALTLAAGALGEWNLDASRYARETMPPVEYLGTTYYEHWLYGLEKLLIERGLLAEGEIETRMRAPAATTPTAPAERRAIGPEPLQAGLARGGNARERDQSLPPRFAVGQVVRVSHDNPIGHTRAPRYVRGRCGVIHIDHGVFVFPDTHAATGDRNPQHCYSVRFNAAELWGSAADRHSTVYVDLWDDYLEAA